MQSRSERSERARRQAVQVMDSTTARAAMPSAPPPLVRWMRQYLGLQEERGPNGEPANTGTLICEWLRAAGVACPNPWCAAQVSRGLAETGASRPTYRGARALGYAEESPRDYQASLTQAPPQGALVQYRWSARAQHIAVVDSVMENGRYRTISGNTSGPPCPGDHGCGVFRHVRQANRANFYAPTRVIPVTY